MREPKLILALTLNLVIMVADASSGLLSPKGVNFEVAALMSMKKQIRDPNHVLDGWDINSVDPCTWNMVGCSVEGFVVSLEMSSVGLSGTLSPSIGNLTHLQTMLLQNNQLTGVVPPDIGNLSELQTLDLSGNQFFGEIPSSLGCVKHLNYLRLSRNKLSGQIPTSIANLTVQQDYEFNIGHLKRFSLHELQVATSNFSSRNIVGKGGFGVIYKGSLPNKTVVAVKRFKDPSLTGEVQFQTEVEMIGLALHRNLLRLYGFCMTPMEKLLVYPFLPNGSVADRLRDPCQEQPSLDWSKRMCIAVGAARGLLYLHEQCNPKIIHRDVKAANILLDENFEAVVGDFGLAKLLDPQDSHVTTAVRGTVGHIAPEYLSTGQSSEKTDVFGFGILLLELVTGQKALDAANVQVQKGMILDWVRTLYEIKKLEELVDKNLRGCFNADELEKVVGLTLQCTQSNPDLRPNMSKILKILASGEREPSESPGVVDPCQGTSFSFPGNFSQAHEESSFVSEAIELSGPR
ncbi:hypothetical protein F511_38423 [Dorcoceras hygrometricum]|uniref:non-specific serine/threonine protein kinase n=1 Tax=Dorcoceras hygrometricum TaxID=472368 RepID=A0A2Z7AC44_9LAMI|nr:hypothetical protein F511_38423 [Dorcoceras hygrometricum]